MRKQKLAAICAVSLTVLAMAGCSSTSDVAAPTFADVDAAAVAMQAKYTDANGDLLVGVDRASGAEINSAANATYTGYVGGDVAGSTLVGTLEVAADFTALTTASSATGFIHETDGDYAGTLSGAGVIAPSAPLLAPQISTTVAGTLVNGGVNYATSLALDGQFVENAADPVGAIAGTADGVVGTDLLIGTFAAEK